MKIFKSIFVAMALSAALVSCGTGSKGTTCEKNDEPFFQMRGIVLCWDDIINPEVIDWIELMHKNGLNTISVCGHDYSSPEYLEMRQKFIDEGFDFEYEEHAMSYLLPREVINEHPEYFRMDKDGKRVADGNGCPSSEEGLAYMMSNVAEFARIHKPSNHKYYFWLFDGGDVCHCEKCEGHHYTPSDQALIFENHIIKALREVDPEAKLAHLAYNSTTPAPTCVKPEEGIFLEFAPFHRTWDKPLSDKKAIREGETWSHGEQLRMLEDNLRVFGTEDAQVLEYWLDVSMDSDWKTPHQKLRHYHQDVFLDDLKTYASYGIRNITAYGIYIDDYYVNTFKDISFVDEYGQGLLNYRDEVFTIGRKQQTLKGFHAPWDGLDDDTEFKCNAAGKWFNFQFTVNDSTITLNDVNCEDDINPEDRIEVFFCPDKTMKRYYCLEVDALGRVMDYAASFPAKLDYSWNFETLKVSGELTEGGYVVKGKVALDELRSLGVDVDNCFYMGVFRDDFRKDGSVNWYSYIPTDDEAPNFHKPDILFKAVIK